MSPFTPRVGGGSAFYARQHYNMSAWRRIAIDKLPKQKDLIAKSESVGMLWVDLWCVFLAAHKEPVDEATIRGVYEFAKWTYAESRDAEIATSTCCHFYEHLPLERRVRERLPQYMSRQEILVLSEVFKCHLTPDKHHEFMQEFGGASWSARA
jgi:hypothetical protein